jgi:prepilin-type N-terminal cleavage/methylation domain-containing protein
MLTNKHLRSSANRRGFSKRSGYTLIELIVTVATISTLMSLLIPNSGTVNNAANDNQNESAVMQVATAVFGLGDEASP